MKLTSQRRPVEFLSSSARGFWTRRQARVVLTLHRQLVIVTPAGYMATMGNPRNNLRHTFIYRREGKE